MDEILDVAPQGNPMFGGQPEPAHEVQPTEDNTPGTSATQPTPWDSEENPYRQRFTGLQGNFQQVIQENRQLKTQMLQQQEAMLVNQAQAAGKSPEEIAGIRQLFQGRAAQVQAMDELSTQTQQLQSQRQVLEPMARQFVISTIAQKYGLQANDLADAPNPEAAEYLARKLSGKPASHQRLSRPAGTVSNVESSGGFRASGGLKVDDLPISEKLKLGVQREIQRGNRTRR